MSEDKPEQVPLLVRLEPALKEELDRLRFEEGLRINFIVNTAIREWLHRYNAPIDAVRRGVVKQMAKAARERAKEEREWDRFQQRAAKKAGRKRKETR